jgi:hypothetical protein
MLLLFQQVGEGAKRLMGKISTLTAFFTTNAMLGINGPGMDIVVAVYAQQFPIASIGRVVVVIVVLVMDSELLEFFARKLPATDAAHPWKHFEGLLSIGLLSLFLLSQGFIRHSFFIPDLVLHIF